MCEKFICQDEKFAQRFGNSFWEYCPEKPFLARYSKVNPFLKEGKSYFYVHADGLVRCTEKKYYLDQNTKTCKLPPVLDDPDILFMIDSTNWSHRKKDFRYMSVEDTNFLSRYFCSLDDHTIQDIQEPEGDVKQKRDLKSCGVFDSSSKYIFRHLTQSEFEEHFDSYSDLRKRGFQIFQLQEDDYQESELERVRLLNIAGILPTLDGSYEDTYYNVVFVPLARISLTDPSKKSLVMAAKHLKIEFYGDVYSGQKCAVSFASA